MVPLPPFAEKTIASTPFTDLTSGVHKAGNPAMTQIICLLRCDCTKATFFYCFLVPVC